MAAGWCLGTVLHPRAQTSAAGFRVFSRLMSKVLVFSLGSLLSFPCWFGF